MKKLPILIFIALCLTALATSYGSYRSAERAIEGDMRQALAKTFLEGRRIDLLMLQIQWLRAQHRQLISFRTNMVRQCFILFGCLAIGWGDSLPRH